MPAHQKFDVHIEKNLKSFIQIGMMLKMQKQCFVRSVIIMCVTRNFRFLSLKYQNYLIMQIGFFLEENIFLSVTL